jgi:adenylate cyclase
VASFFGADFNAARKHLERGFSLYESEAHGRHDLSYIEDDPGQTCLAYLAQVLWVLGYPDQALERSDQAILVATATADAPSLGEAMIWRAEIALFRGEVHDTRERAAAVLALANEHGLPVWAGLANIMHGWALSEQDQGADGVAQIRDGLSLLLKTGHQLFRLHFTAMLVDALVKIGQAEEALTAISEAIESSQRARVNYWESELQRRRGELLLVSTHSEEAAAETCLRRAIEIAQAQTARSLELRAAASLARLLAKRGERQQAYDLLVPIYGWFTEGFETRNLKEARAVLDSLNPDGAATGKKESHAQGAVPPAK